MNSSSKNTMFGPICGGVDGADECDDTAFMNNVSQVGDPTYPSICIPRTWSNVTWDLVKDAFEEILGGGCIERVDVVKRQHKDGTEFNKIFIHFKAWPDTEYAQSIRQKIMTGKTIKVVYQFPWYWKCMMSYAPKRRWKGHTPYIEEEMGCVAGAASGADCGAHVGAGCDMGVDMSNEILACMEEGHQLPDGRIVGGSAAEDPVIRNF